MAYGIVNVPGLSEGESGIQSMADVVLVARYLWGLCPQIPAKGCKLPLETHCVFQSVPKETD